MMKRSLLYILGKGVMIAGVLPLLLMVMMIACSGSTPAIANMPSSTLISTPNRTQGYCQEIATQGTLVGKTWNLTVSFLVGARKGQEEISQMTFLPNGQLTATFPEATPGSAALPPGIDGHWCSTGINGFAYRFKDPILQNGKMVAYIAVSVHAYLTTPDTFEAGGIGIGYLASGQPLGTYNVTRTDAVALI